MTRTWFTYTSNQQSDFAISRGFDFHETSHLRSCENQASRKFHTMTYMLLKTCDEIKQKVNRLRVATK